MRLKATLSLAALALVLAAPGFGQEAQGTLSMSLEECIVKALKDNLGVAIQVLGPQMSAEAVNLAQEQYIPTLSLSARSQKAENAAYSYLDSPGAATINQTQNYNFLNVSQSLPTGGTFNLGFTGYRTTTNTRGITIDPRYGTTLSFNLSQPLLRNFGLKINRQEILVARNNLGVSEENLKATLMTTVYNVESAYWSLVYSIENLDVRRQSLKLAQDLLEKNQRSVEVGTLAPIEVLSAQAEVATREADLIQAETQIKSNEDQLKLLLHITGDEDKNITALVPKDKPTYVQREVNLEEALAAAIANRTELKIAQLGLQNDRLSLSFAKNQTLPDLNLSASYSSPGIDGTRIFYVGDPLLGDHRSHRPRRHHGGRQTDIQVHVSQLESGPDPEPAPGERLLEGLPGPGQAQSAPVHARSREPEGRDLSRDQERRPRGRRELQEDPCLHQGPGAGRAEARRRGGEIPGRPEHQLYCPDLPTGPGHRADLRAQRHRLLQRLHRGPRKVDGDEPPVEEHQSDRLRARPQIGTATSDDTDSPPAPSEGPGPAIFRGFSPDPND